MKTLFYKTLPKKGLSLWFGRLADVQFKPVAKFAIFVFKKLYGIKLDDYVVPKGGYKSLQEFFIRPLKPGARAVGENDLVSPVDGKLSQCGVLKADQPMVQAKGFTYEFRELIPDQKLQSFFAEGSTWQTIYLAPYNYHRIHSPVKGKILSTHHYPGKLWPVNGWSVNTVPDLFCVNERIISHIQPESGGNLLVIMVGATNVGRIALSYDPFWKANVGQRYPRSQTHTPEISVEKAEEIARFELGSTVILVADKEFSEKNTLDINHLLDTSVLMGQDLK